VWRNLIFSRVDKSLNFSRLRYCRRLKIKTTMDPSEKHADLRRRIKSMHNARLGKTLVSETKQNMTKKDRRKMKKVVKSSQVDELLKAFNLNDYGTKLSLQKAIQEGRIATMDDLAAFMSSRTKQPVTAADLMGGTSTSTSIPSRPNWMQDSEREAIDLMTPHPQTAQSTKYATASLSSEHHRPPMRAPMRPPTTVTLEDLE
jgi:hypothetical protein